MFFAYVKIQIMFDGKLPKKWLSENILGTINILKLLSR